jgi:hypothetical protein
MECSEQTSSTDLIILRLIFTKCVLLQELQKSTEVATGGLHNAMPKFLGSLGIKFGFRQVDSIYIMLFQRSLRGVKGPKEQLLSTFVTVTNLKHNR